MIPHPVVDVRDATVRLDGRPVLHGLTMRVEVGELLVLLGPNGSGKSTLVRATIGLVPLATGQVRLFDTPLNRFRAWARIGYVPQRATAGAGVPATVAEVAGSGRLAGARWWRGLRRTDREATGRALELVGLADRAGDRVGALSGGQQQRVLIARALTMEPDLLVMDEPMAGVDIAHQEAFAGTVERLLRDGRTIVLVAHELGALERLVHRTVILRGGEVLYDGPPPPSDPRADHTHPHAAPTRLADTSSLRWQL